MNLLTELKKTARINAEKIIQEQDEVLSYFKNTLETAHKKDLEMLKHFGTSHIIRESKSVKKAAVEKGEYLTEDDIKLICNRYALKMLPTYYYKNEVPMSALNDMVRFQETEGVTFGGAYKYGPVDESGLYIIAPKSHFKLTSRPKSDPVLLFKTKNGNYKIISVWGNDFSFFQRIRGVASCDNVGHLVCIGIPLIMEIIFYNQLTGRDRIGAMGLGGALSAVVSLSVGCFISSLGSKYNEPYE